MVNAMAAVRKGSQVLV